MKRRIDSASRRTNGGPTIGLLAACLIVSAMGVAPAEGQRLVIAPKLRAGDSFRLEITTGITGICPVVGPVKEDSVGEREVTVDVQVVAADTDGFALEWLPRETSGTDVDPAKLPLLLRLDAGGRLAGLTNEAETVRTIRPAIERMVTEILEDVPSQQRDELASRLRVLISPEKLRWEATKLARPYFDLYGVSLVPGGALERRLERPWIFGKMVPARLRVEIESVSDETAVLRSMTTYDAASMERALRMFAAPRPESTLDIEFIEEGTYVFDRKTGLMRDVKVSTRFSADGTSAEWTSVIRLISGPAR